jgi:hypothetical protein
MKRSEIIKILEDKIIELEGFKKEYESAGEFVINTYRTAINSYTDCITLLKHKSEPIENY